MTASLLARNILMYSLQIGAITAVAALFPLKAAAPKIRLLFWQAVLLALLLLPGLRVWSHPAPGGTVTVSATIGAAVPVPVRRRLPFFTAQAVLAVLAAGFLARVFLLGLGLVRLRRYRLRSRPLPPGSPWGSEADLRLSNEIKSPVTFGWRRPVVLLPADFPSLSEPVRDAILCHEILHVRRNDWAFTAAEEMVRAVFWFHPAMWWLLGEIQLAREETVDREVVETLNCRQNYVDALLAVAGAAPPLDLAPAPLFLRKRHLKRRVISILKELKMSQSKTLSALAAGLVVMAASCWFITGALPLRAAPQAAESDAGHLITIGAISLSGLSDTQKTQLLSHLAEMGIREGQQMDSAGLRLTAQTLAETYVGQQAVALVRATGPNGEIFSSLPGVGTFRRTGPTPSASE